MTLTASMTANAPSTDSKFLSGRLFDYLAFCQSRLTTVQELLHFSASDPDKVANALFIAELLYVDQVKIAHRLMARPVPELSSIERAREAICSLEGMPLKQALTACAEQLHDAQTALEDDFRYRAALGAGKELVRIQRGLRALARSTERLSQVSVVPAWHTWARRTVTLVVVVVAMWFSFRLLSDMLTLGYFHTRAGHFFGITEALERYRVEHGSYPVSAIDGSEWNGIGWKGDPQNWIPGLVPGYLARLPRDPRNTTIPHAQYIYRSDGKDYKLIAMQPEDCEAVIAHRQQYSDPARNSAGRCLAYGMWTKGGTAW